MRIGNEKRRERRSIEKVENVTETLSAEAVRASVESLRYRCASLWSASSNTCITRPAEEKHDVCDFEKQKGENKKK